ncbi:MAG TPA: tryptophan--tRNA ligase [Micavibrio sp.]|nr:tryptophan--tRNA ligase [Micavibrio sp.]
MNKKRIFSGMQPTNRLQLGNYLGALKNWVKLQDEPGSECIYCVVDLHANTTGYNPDTLKYSTREVAAAYIAAGVDPARSMIFPQSAVSGHAELGWMLGCITPLGWLNRMTQFKDKAGKDKEKASAGLYTYPVLMAADVLLYHATHVPVGDDQKQHVELMRDIAISFNQHVAKRDFFPLPEPVIMGEATRVMSLRDGTQKMSKSAESDMSRINMTDDADTIANKIRKAKTDAGNVPSSEKEFEGRPEAKNLITIFAALEDSSRESVMAEYGGKQFSAFKNALSDLTVAKMGPITERMRELMADPAEIDRILDSSAGKAAAIAEPILKDAIDIMGFWRK